MARQKGTLIIGSNIENNASAPLDARMLVKTVAELTDANSFPYFYKGMIVSVQENNKVYHLIGNDPTQSSNWEEVGSGLGAYNVIEGYFNAADNLFYEENTYTTPITGESEKIYISIDIDKSYRYNGSIFVRLDDETIDYFQVDTLPAVTSTDAGKIVQYIGATGSGLENGYFYQCIEDSGNPGTYIWVQKNIQPDADTTIQVDTMPMVTSTDLGRIVQYVATTTTVELIYENGYFYEVIEDTSTTPSTYKWEEKQVQAGGGSGSGSLGKDITAAIDVGGIDTGDSFLTGTNYDDMWDALLNPTLYPTLTDPDATLTYGANDYYAIGATIPTMSAIVGLDRGLISPAYGTSGYRAGAATSYTITTVGADVDYTNTSTTSGNFTIPALVRTDDTGDLLIMANVDYSVGEQPKDSKGNNYNSPLAAGTVTKIKTIHIIKNYYYGASNSSTISDFTGLTAKTEAKGNKTYKFTTANQYMVFAYDKDYGNLKSILDQNGFEVISGWTKTVQTIDGFDYNVYVANLKTTDTNASFTFKI